MFNSFSGTPAPSSTWHKYRVLPVLKQTSRYEDVLWSRDTAHALTSALDGSGQLHAPAALSPGKKTQVTLAQAPGWAPEPVCALWIKEKSPPL